jgi:hypothetical protein
MLFEEKKKAAVARNMQNNNYKRQYMQTYSAEEKELRKKNKTD